MGNKRPSVRTLPTGEKVVHYPDGSQYLVPANKMKTTLLTNAAETEQEIADAAQRVLDGIDAKQASLDAGDTVPNEKRPI